MSTKKTWRIIDVIRWATQFFQERHINSPRLNIELITAEVLKLNRVELYLKYDLPLSETELRKIREFVIRRANYEPLQYIIGRTTFCNVDLILNKNVLIPRPETELLVNLICEQHYQHFINQSPLNILDIGCGSGAICIALAKTFPSANILAIDISNEALALSKQNAKANNISNIKFQKIDILSEYPQNLKFDLIVSNPPYISLEEYQQLPPEIKHYEPRQSLTDENDGLTFYRRFSEIFPLILDSEGKFFLEIGYCQLKKIEEIFKVQNISIKSYKDFNGIERIISNE